MDSADKESELPTRVRAARRALKWTQEQAARESGVGVRTFQMFENGQSWPQPANLRAILRAVGLEVESEEVLDPPRILRGEFPRDIEVFLSMLGAYLNTLPEAQRLEVIHDLTRQIFQAHRGGGTDKS